MSDGFAQQRRTPVTLVEYKAREGKGAVGRCKSATAALCRDIVGGFLSVVRPSLPAYTGYLSVDLGRLSVVACRCCSSGARMTGWLALLSTECEDGMRQGILVCRGRTPAIKKKDGIVLER